MGLSFVCIHYLSSNITYIFQLYICNGSPNLSWYNFLSFIAFNNFTYNTFIVWVSLSPQESWFYSISTNTIEHCPHLNYVKLISITLKYIWFLAKLLGTMVLKPRKEKPHTASSGISKTYASNPENGRVLGILEFIATPNQSALIAYTQKSTESGRFKTSACAWFQKFIFHEKW